MSEQLAKGNRKKRKKSIFVGKKLITEGEVAPVSVISSGQWSTYLCTSRMGSLTSKQVLHLPTNNAPASIQPFHSILGARTASCSRTNLSILNFLIQITSTVRIRTISGHFTRALQLHWLWCCWERDLSTANSSTEPPSPQICCFSRQKDSKFCTLQYYPSVKIFPSLGYFPAF